ncbi:MAG: HTTM domain-containing protein [Polyangiales bacterium]
MREPIDGASLGVFRAGYGLMMLVSVLRFWARGWIEELYIQPEMFFPYWGFSWVQPWPGVGMYVHFAALGALAGLIMVGLWSRPALFLFFIGFTYVELIDRTTYLNHYYLISILALLMVFLPVDRAFSLRSLLARPRQSATIPRWCLHAIRMQVGLVYVTAGLAKLRADWLLRAEPLHTWLGSHAELPVVGPLLAHTAVAFAMSWAGALFDLFVVVFLLYRPTRPFAYASLVIFHTITGLLFPIGVFPIVMALSATIFFEPDWPRRFTGPAPAALLDHAVDRSSLKPLQKLGFMLLAAHFAFQVVFPWRQFLYPGNTCWTEQGFRFSWHVMLMEKTGQVDFRVVDNQRGKSWTVYPREHLSALQHWMMSTQPDMILSFAHHLRRQWSAEGYPDVSVYADAWASLNGRRRQRLIDPNVDLGRRSEGWGQKDWIVPLADLGEQR